MLVIALILGFYCFLVILLIIGWNKSIRKRKPSSSAREEFISVIIPVRNEAKQLERLLGGLAKLNYTNFEIIMVDDHSSDDTLQIIRSRPMPQLSVHTNPGKGKKRALTEGIKRSAGQIIVTTDADCSLHPDWLKTINRYFQNKNVLFLFGPVRLCDTPNFFARMQAIEFASLIGSAAATAAFGIPTMCNGANLAYRKDAFEEVKGYEGNVHVPSGDDEFLMRKIYKKFPEGILFAAAEAAVVETPAQPDIKSFFQQRLRWAAKWKYNSSWSSVVLALFIVASQISALLAFIALLTSVSPLLLSLVLLKVLLECIFLFQVCSFLKIPWNWLVFIVLQFIYPVYVVIVGVASNFLSYSWKDRRIK